MERTSEEWHKVMYSHVTILDPDGWDKKNFDYSWFVEEISANEFMKRVNMSTCEVNAIQEEKKRNIDYLRKGYIVVVEADIRDFENAVNELIKRGWKVRGGMVIESGDEMFGVSTKYYQSMMKEN